MGIQLYFLTIAFSLFFIFFVIELVRRGSLREQYSLLWLVLGLVMLILSASKSLLQVLAKWFGVYYAPSLLFLVGLICAFALLLHVTIAISRLTDRVIRLTQELGISQHRIATLEQQLDQSGNAERRPLAADPTGTLGSTSAARAEGDV